MSQPPAIRHVRRRIALLPALPLAALAAAGWLGSNALLRRRDPDPPDPPSNYGLSYEDVRFPSRDGTPLRGWWIRPPQPNGGTLVLCHGHNGSMDGDTAQAARLARAGFAVLMFNFRAHGTSGGAQVTFGAREYQDVLGALDWLGSAQGIRRAGLVGFSMGAGVALIAAAHDSRVGAVVADGAIRRVGDAMLGLGRARGLPAWLVWPLAAATLLTASLRARVWIPQADPVCWVGRVRCPVLFVHGAEDPFTSLDAVREMAARVGEGAALWVVPGAGHRDAYRLDPAAYYGRVIAFLEPHLLHSPDRASAA